MMQPITPRQRQVLELICEGCQAKEIAVKLGISYRTVQLHRQRMGRKYGLHTIAQLVRFAVREGLVRA